MCEGFIGRDFLIPVPADGGQAKMGKLQKSKSLQGRSTVLFTVLNMIKASYRQD